MSYDISLMIDTGNGNMCQVIEIGNYTYNCANMFIEAANGKGLSEFNGTNCKKAIKPLTQIIKEWNTNPEKYLAMNPPNGWGDFHSFKKYIKKLLNACIEHPKCWIKIT